MAHPAVPLSENMDRIRVLAAESTWMSSQLLAEALAQDCRLEVIGVEPKQPSILAAVAKRRPHVILLSSALEDSASQGFELAREISLASPGTRIILLMDVSHPSSVVEAFRCGAQGIFSRTESSKILAKCIHSVHRGQVWANSAELGYVIGALKDSEPVRPAVAGGGAILSKREQDVVRCVAEGLSNRQIATRLRLTEHTVKNYLFRIFDKLGVSSRVEVALYVFRFHKDWIANSPSQAHIQASVAGPRLLNTPRKAASMMPPPLPPTLASGI